jgi:SAM-dependent methyltransferase
VSLSCELDVSGLQIRVCPCVLGQLSLMGHFDLVARFYDRIFRYPGPARLLNGLQLHPGDRLLDVGGGTGRVSETFGSHVQVVVCDPAPRMLNEARGKGLAACAGVAEHLPFADRSFKRMVAVDAFHHFDNQRVAAAELLRVLHPGGRLVVEEPDIRRAVVKLAALLERLLLLRSRFLSLSDLMCMFTTDGAAILSTEERLDSNVRLVMSRREKATGQHAQAAVSWERRASLQGPERSDRW